MIHPGDQRRESRVPFGESSQHGRVSVNTSLALAMSCLTPTQSSAPAAKGSGSMSSNFRESKLMCLRLTSKSWVLAAVVWGVVGVATVGGGGGVGVTGVGVGATGC